MINNKTIVVFAYHDIGLTGIKCLLDNNLTIGLVVTHKDNPKENTWFGSVSNFCKINKINYILYEDYDFKKIFSITSSLKPILLISMYFRKIIPNDILEIPINGAINLHGSLLPKYRGRAPINWQLLNGETEGGVTLHYMVNKPDAGDIICQEKVQISQTDNPISLYSKLEKAAAKLLNDNISDIVSGNSNRTPQKESEATYYGGRNPEDGYINWSNGINEIYNLVRAVTKPYPGAFTYFNDKKIIIWKVEKSKEDLFIEYGYGYFKIIDQNICVRCKDGFIIIKEFYCKFTFDMVQGKFT